MAGYSTRQSTYTDGDVINAADSNDEFDQILAAFNASTGHNHDGTAGEGSRVTVVGTAANNVTFGAALTPDADNTIDIGTSAAEFKDLYLDGVAYVDSIAMPTTTVTDILDEDAMTSNSASALATQQSIKAYVDAQVTAQDLDFQADTGGALNIDLDSESLTFTGGTGIDTSGSGNAVTFAIDSTVATLTGTQTLTNKTIDVDSNTVSNIEVDNLKTGVLDTDLSSVAATDTTLASAKAIKTYVDAQVATKDALSELSGDTDDVSEGSTNLYFTNERVDDRVNGLLTAGSNVTLTYDDVANTLTIAATEDDLSNNDTDDLAEGTTNLYFTNTRADARITNAIGSTVQAYDAELAALAGLTSAADKGIQFTGSGTAATYDLTAAGKALLDDADASAQRTTMGVAIGSDVQAYDAGLASIAGLTTAANKVIYTTASDTYAVTDFTAFGRSLVDDADAAAGRTTLGLGTAATVDTGTSAGNAVILDGSARLPAVDGSQLTNITITEQDPQALAFAIALG